MGKWAKYARRYQKEWELEPDFKDWIAPSRKESDSGVSKDMAYCKACKCDLRPHAQDLRLHTKRRKHAKNMAAMAEAAADGSGPVIHVPRSSEPMEEPSMSETNPTTLEVPEGQHQAEMSASISEVSALRAEVAAKDAEIQRLRQALSRQATDSVIDEGLTKNDVSRYSRQMLLPGFGVKGQKALKSASVLIVGAGGLGCPCAAYLASAGVGRIGIVDFDTVEESNLHRQILHSEAKVGLSKVDSLVIALRQLNSQPEYVQHAALLDSSNALDIIGRYQVVIDASDNVATRYLVNDACVRLGKPLVSGSALRWEGQLTVYNYQGGPCYRCLFPKPPPSATVTNCSEGGVVGMVPGVIGCMQALEVVKILTGSGEVCSGRLLLFDGADARWRQVSLRAKLPDCAVCSIAPSTVSLLQDYATWCGAGPADKCCNISLLPKELRMSCQELKDRLEDDRSDCLLLDVRPTCQFEMCHLAKSINVPLERLDLLEIALLEQKLEDASEVVVLCRRGNDSQLAVEKLREAWKERGVQVRDVRGGLEAWAKTVDPTFPTY